MGMMNDDNDNSTSPWSFSFQVIGTVALVQSVFAHYVSTAPCLCRAHWNTIVIGNLANVVVFAWVAWLITALCDGSKSGAWVVVLTVLAAVAGCITTAASCFFCPEHDDAYIDPTSSDEPDPESDSN